MSPAVLEAEMGIREKLNEKQHLTITAASLITVLAVAFIIYSSFGGNEEPPVILDKAWFSADDGATWFVDDASKSPPFKTSDGKIAVRAFVYKCKDGKPFIAYLMKYLSVGEQKSEGEDGLGYGNALTELSGVRVKKPGQREWTSTQHPASAAIRTPVCPDGQPRVVPTPVTPETADPDRQE